PGNLRDTQATIPACFRRRSVLRTENLLPLHIGAWLRNPQSPPTHTAKKSRQVRPYVYSVEEVQKMIRVVDNRHRGQWHLEPYTIRTLILLLHGTGLRIGEAIRLQHQDMVQSQFSDSVRPAARAGFMRNIV